MVEREEIGNRAVGDVVELIIYERVLLGSLVLEEGRLLSMSSSLDLRAVIGRDLRMKCNVLEIEVVAGEGKLVSDPPDEATQEDGSAEAKVVLLEGALNQVEVFLHERDLNSESIAHGGGDRKSAPQFERNENTIETE